jgi:hypothetical protein
MPSTKTRKQFVDELNAERVVTEEQKQKDKIFGAADHARATYATELPDVPIIMGGKISKVRKSLADRLIAKGDAQPCPAELAQEWEIFSAVLAELGQQHGIKRFRDSDLAVCWALWQRARQPEE